ncbi:MAG: DUF4365 domain-containing protein [Candidatus Thiodiazotropha endolucinida]|nr:DUF4365 domain-containing protein [Candidatus Thiodiazotropha endolucinida]
MYGFQVYGSEVDDRGIDFVARYEKGPYFSMQVKSIREKGYVFLQKEKFQISSDWYLALAILNQGKEPELYLVPSEAWVSPNSLLVDREYEGKKVSQNGGSISQQKIYRYWKNMYFIKWWQSCKQFS